MPLSVAFSVDYQELISAIAYGEVFVILIIVFIISDFATFVFFIIERYFMKYRYGLTASKVIYKWC